MSTLMPDSITTPQHGGPRPTWLWQPYIPCGKITLLAGDPGLGKSFLALDIAARLSRGNPMPGPNPGIISLGAPPIGNRQWEIGNPCDTLLLSAEDELHDTILPRLAALGADPDRIHPLRCLDAHTQYPEPFSLKEDIGEFSFAIEEHNAKLVILDPITAFMAGIDLNSTAAIRHHLAPLAQLAAFYGVAVIAITHLNKEAHQQSVFRATGSLALAAMARSVYLVERGPMREGYNVLSPVKANLASGVERLAFRMAQGRVEWLGVAESEELEPVDAYECHDRQAAVDFLKASLVGGGKAAVPLIREARSLAISERTLRRAKVDLGVVSRKEHATWLWEMAGEGCQGGQ